MATAKKKSGTLKIKWVRSFIGCPRGMRQTIRGLGFRRMQQVVERPDTPAIRGMLAKVHHLIEIEGESGTDMEPTLSNLKPPRGSRHRKVRVGRGMGSKMGKTSGAGNKGQQSRRGYSRRPGFEGGQMPLHRRLPKRGFSSPFGKTFAVVNVESLNAFPAGETVTPETLATRGIVRAMRDGVKVLGDGELKVALTVRAHAFSKSAQDKIAAAGGKAEVLK